MYRAEKTAITLHVKMTPLPFKKTEKETTSNNANLPPDNPTHPFKRLRLEDAQSRHYLKIHGGFSAEQIIVLGKARAETRQLDIQDTKKQISLENKRTHDALELAHSERLAKEDAIQKALAAEAELAALKQSLGLT